MKKVFVIVALAVLMTSLGFAQKDDIGSLFTFDTLVLVLSLMTPILTSLFKKVFKTKGTATVLANAVINGLTKGVMLVASGQATIAYAFVYFIIGLLVDKGIHKLLTDQAQEVEKGLSNSG